MLTEARAVRSEWEVLPPDEEGNHKSVFKEIADENENHAAAEAEEVRERVKREFEDFLDGEEDLSGLIRCLGEGTTKPSGFEGTLSMDATGSAQACQRLDMT